MLPIYNFIFPLEVEKRGILRIKLLEPTAEEINSAIFRN